jgi:hypothetical protein
MKIVIVAAFKAIEMNTYGPRPMIASQWNEMRWIYCRGLSWLTLRKIARQENVQFVGIHKRS